MSAIEPIANAADETEIVVIEPEVLFEVQARAEVPSAAAGADRTIDIGPESAGSDGECPTAVHGGTLGLRECCRSRREQDECRECPHERVPSVSERDFPQSDGMPDRDGIGPRSRPRGAISSRSPTGTALRRFSGYPRFRSPEHDERERAPPLKQSVRSLRGRRARARYLLRRSDLRGTGSRTA